MIMRLPIHPRPLPHEALSSWVERILRSYPKSARVEVAHHLGLTHQPIRQLDFDLHDETSVKLSRATGVAMKRIEHMTVWSLRERIWGAGSDDDSADGKEGAHYSFLLPDSRFTLTEEDYQAAWISKYHRPYSRICGRCLDQDAVPYIRLIWQLPILASCPRHGVLLQFGGLPFEGERVRPVRLKDPHEETSSPGVRRHDQRTLQAISQGKVSGPSGVIPSVLWFRIIRGIIQELSRPLWAPKPKRKMVDKIRRAAGSCYQRQEVLNFEWVNHDQQHDRLKLAATAIDLAEAGEITPRGTFAALLMAN